MNHLNTEDCKQFIINYYKQNNINTSINEWKRTRKYKISGIVHRDFKHATIGNITLKEYSGHLFVALKENIQPHITHMAFSYQGIIDTEGNQLIEGSIKKLSNNI